jgi:hypothetical protein
MSSARQIAANRRNASKSSGPRSKAGKKRASRNAESHGLFSVVSRKALSEEITALAGKLAGNVSGEVALEHARIAAEAQIELRRIDNARCALIDRASTFGSLRAPRFSQTDQHAARKGQRPKLPKVEDFLSTMPQDEVERSYEAMRRIAPELAKLAQYEQRARGRRDRAIRKLLKQKLVLMRVIRH